MGPTQIDSFKKRAIARIFARGEPVNTYPIDDSDLLTVDRCNLCHSDNISRLTEVYLETRLNFLSTSVCIDCMYTFRSISPSHRWFKKCWKKIAMTKLEVFNPEAEFLRKGRYEVYWETLSKYVWRGNLLDVGASYGSGTKVFQDRGFDVEAVEPEDDRAKYLNNYFNFPVIADSIEEAVSRSGNYDLIIFAHCLEHLDDPSFVVSHIKNLLGSVQAILYVETPITRYHVTWNDAFYLAHQSNFSERNIIQLFNKNGFEVLEKIWPWDEEQQVWHLGLVLRQTANGNRASEDIESSAGSTVDEIRMLYRKNLPLAQVPPLDTVIKYNVPYIEQFYQTLRFDTKEIIVPASPSDFITFQSK